MKCFTFCQKLIHSTLFILLWLFLQSSVIGQQATFSVETSGAGTPILFIPGYASTGEIWAETIAQFDSETYECHVLTLAGFGQTSGFKTDNYLQDISLDIVKYIQSNELVKPIIIGHSLGGLVALMVAINTTTPLGKIICVDAWPFTPAAIDPKATVESQKDLAETYFKFDSIPLGIKYTQTREEVRPYVEILTNRKEKVDQLVEMTVHSEDRICKQAMYDMFTVDTRAQLDQISSPVLILGTWFAYKDYGISEASMAESFRNQYEGLDQKEIYVHSDSRHFIMWDAPEWFLYHVFKFINQ